MKNALPVDDRPRRAVRVLVRRRGADERAAAARRLRQRRPRRTTRPPISSPLRSTWSARSCPRRIRSSPNSTSSSSRRRRPRSAASSITRSITLAGDADRLLLRRRARHRPGGPDHLGAQPRTLDDAVDRRLADRADHRAGADDRRDPQPVRHHRARAQGGDRRLSLVLPRHRRHGQRPALARSAAARSDAHLFGDAGADLRRSCARRRARRSFSPA